MKRQVIYKISKGYRDATIWQGESNGSLIGTTRVIMSKGLTRKERYDGLMESLVEHGVRRIPKFSPLSNGVRGRE